jgi:hypothetical protein
MNWPALDDDTAVRLTILDDTTAAQTARQRWGRDNESKIGARVWMWLTDGSRSDDGRLGAVAVCKHGNEWRSRRSFGGTGRFEVFDAELWPIRLALDVGIEKRETLQKHGVKTVAVFSE